MMAIALRMATTGALAAAAWTVQAAGAPPVESVATIPMPGVKGRIDHLAADVAGHRLFVAALGNDTVEVLDTSRNRRVKSLSGFGEPQGVAYLPNERRLYVANGAANRVDLLDGDSLTVVKRLSALEDSDNVRYDTRSGAVLVGYGAGALRALDASTGEPRGDTLLPGHPESFQIENEGMRAFVNVPTARLVAVVDRMQRRVVERWPVPVRANFPMALDEQGRRLFVGARSPAVMLVYDIDSGHIVARLPIGRDSDDLFYDLRRQRVYVICGEGRIDVFQLENDNRYVHERSIETAPRARTGLFVPEESKLYVAAPATGGSPARVLVYRIGGP